MDRDRYNKAILAMLDYRASVISVDSGVLVGTLMGTTSIPLPRGYAMTCSVLGGPKADMTSHVTVALEALSQIWDSDEFPQLVKGAATGALLEAILKGRWGDISEFIRTMRTWGRQQIRARRAFLQYIEDWLQGHFVTVPLS